MKKYIIVFLVSLISISLQAEEELISSSEPSLKQLCFFSLNNEKEFHTTKDFFDEVQKQTSAFVNVKEYQANGTDPKRSFTSMINSSVRCDGLVLSGHHTSDFGGKRARGTISINFLEKLSCQEEYADWFSQIKSVWLQGCRTLSSGKTGEFGQGDLEEFSADFHMERVGNVLEEDHLEQNYEQLNTEFSTIFDDHNPISQRYVRIFKGASLFGWTRLAPGEKTRSENSITYHLAHNLFLGDRNRPVRKDINRLGTKKAHLYKQTILDLLNGVNYENTAEAWENHGRKNTGNSSLLSFRNQDIKAIQPTLYLENQELFKEVKALGCQLRGLNNKRSPSQALQIVLSDPELLGYNFNIILNKRIKSRNQRHDRALRNSHYLNQLIVDKLNSKKMGIVKKWDIYLFYKKVFRTRDLEFEERLFNQLLFILNYETGNNLERADFKTSIYEALFTSYYLLNSESRKVEIAAATRKEDHPRVIKKLIYFYGRSLDSKRFAPSVENYINHKKPSVRKASFELLKYKSYRKSDYEFLNLFVQDKDPSVRIHVLNHMGNLSRTNRARTIENVILNSQEPAVKKVALSKVRLLRKKDRMKAFEQLLNDRDTSVKEAILINMKYLKRKERLVIVEHFSNDTNSVIRNQASATLAQLKKNKKEPAFGKQFDADNRK